MALRTAVFAFLFMGLNLLPAHSYTDESGTLNCEKIIAGEIQVPKKTTVISTGIAQKLKSIDWYFAPIDAVPTNPSARVLVLDTPAQSNDFTVVIDHHALNRNPKQPSKNTARQVISIYEKELKKDSSENAHDRAVFAMLQQLIGLTPSSEDRAQIIVKSNNAFDTELPLMILQNPEVLRSDSLRALIKKAAYQQDFGHFGVSVLTGTDAEKISNALYAFGDQMILENPELFDPETDRFAKGANPLKVNQLMERLVQNAYRAVSDEAYRNKLSAEYTQRIEKAIKEIKATAIVSAESLGLSASDAKTLSNVAFIDAGKIPAGYGPGLSWAASARAHGAGVAVRYRALENGRLELFISVPAGSEGKAYGFINNQLLAALKAQHLKGQGNPEEIRLRDRALLFCFEGIIASPVELAKLILLHTEQIQLQLAFKNDVAALVELKIKEDSPEIIRNKYSRSTSQKRVEIILEEPHGGKDITLMFYSGPKLKAKAQSNYKFLYNAKTQIGAIVSLDGFDHVELNEFLDDSRPNMGGLRFGSHSYNISKDFGLKLKDFGNHFKILVGEEYIDHVSN